MAIKFICDGEKYQVGGPKEDTIGLPISLSGLPSTIHIEGYTLFLKTAFHVSLVCVGKIIEKNNITEPNFLKKVIVDFCEFTKHTPIELVGFRDEFRLVAEAERRAVVAMCEISGLPAFFEVFNKKYNLQIEYPPTHATIYTLQPNAGIFLTDSKDLASLSKIIKNPIGQAIKFIL